MAEHELVGFLVADITDVELLVLTPYDAVEHHMLEHIAQLFLDILIVALHQSVTQLESLLNGIGSKTLEGLFPVPWTLYAQAVLHIQQSPESGYFFFLAMHLLILF